MSAKTDALRAHIANLEHIQRALYVERDEWRARYREAAAELSEIRRERDALLRLGRRAS